MPKILIAEDDLEISELLKVAFEVEKYQVIHAADGEEAVNLAIRERPDIVILDILMPKLTGWEVCEKLRENTNTCLTPIIIATSLVATKDKITGLKLGADEYITKPFDPMELVARVERLLQRSRESLAANPLTGFPGASSVEQEIKRRLESEEDFAFSYIDISNFKVFNEKYGFERGDALIRLMAAIIRSAINELGNKDDFMGHLGGDLFCYITTPMRTEVVASRILENFDALIPMQYDDEARKGKGVKVQIDGEEKFYPIASLSIGVADIAKGSLKHYSQVMDRAKGVLKKAKSEGKSLLVKG